VNVQTPNYPKKKKKPTLAYIQTIDVWNDKYKQYPNWKHSKP